ncbi:MAG: sel1 repeat family protein, partial [bacterium]|nr:sel1 repeat family protein [bacterium]
IFCIFAVFIYFWHFTQEPQGHNSAGGISEALDSVNPYAAMAYPELSSELKGDGAEEFRKGAEFYASGDYENAFKEFLKAAEKGFAPAEFNAGCFYFAGKCVKQDFDKAFNFFKKAAEKGNANAECALGICFEYFYGTERCMREACRWYKKSAEDGCSAGKCNYGICLYEGKSIPVNLTKANFFFEDSAASGCPLASAYLAVMALDNKNCDSALRYVKKAQKEGCLMAEYILGCMYDNFEVLLVPSDLKALLNCRPYRGFRLILRAAEKGFPYAAAYDGYETNPIDRILICFLSDKERNAFSDVNAFDCYARCRHHRAFKHFFLAINECIEAGDFVKGDETVSSMKALYLAYGEPLADFYRKVSFFLYYDKKGDKSKLLTIKAEGSAEDLSLGGPSRATEYVENAAESGNRQAVDFLCSGDYSFVRKRYPVTEAEAEVMRCQTYMLYDRALNGDNEAQLAIGLAFGDIRYQNPCSVFSIDYRESFYWIQKAADNGNASAECILGYYFMRGTGCRRDYAKGFRLLEKAADKGNPSAIYRLGVAYASGNGVAQDWNKAVKLYKKAEDKGFDSACISLKYCYKYGKGMKKDLKKYEEYAKKEKEFFSRKRYL